MRTVGETRAVRHPVLWRGLTVPVIAVSTIAMTLTIWRRAPGDLPHYFAALSADGTLYRDVPFEYPPYAAVFFWVAGLARTYEGFAVAFGSLLALCHLASLAMLAAVGRHGASGWRALAPVALFAVAAGLQGFFYFRRFDLIPAALVLGAAFAWSRSGPGWAGALLAVAIATKLYPAALVPVFLAAAWRTRRVRPFLLGLAAGLAPLIPLGFFWPWWRFADLHVARGLHAESLYASLMWALRHLEGLSSVEWVGAAAAYELAGPSVPPVRQTGQLLWVASTLASAAFAARSVLRRTEAPEGSTWAALLLLPLSAFVAFNSVFSPQFLIWLTPLGAWAALRYPWLAAQLLAAVALTGVVYPSATYRTGLDPLHTSALVVRNLLVVSAWVTLLATAWHPSRARLERQRD